MSDKPYDPLPRLIEYFAHSLRSRTVTAANAQRDIEDALGITSDIPAAEAAERVRAAIVQAAAARQNTADPNCGRQTARRLRAREAAGPGITLE